jgi:hypothetical protein
MSSNTSSNNNQSKAKNDFKKIVTDFLKDLLTTFPELRQNLNLHLLYMINPDEVDHTSDNPDISIDYIYSHCKKTFPERFFDILYQNADIFTNEEINTEFLPGIDFKTIWNVDDISERTRETLWKYLQLLLFSVISDISDGSSFGDTAKLFEAINEDEFKSKLEETIENMKNVFDENFSSENVDGSGINLDDLPNAKDMHDHITGMMEGKLGKLAREIAEETASELNVNLEGASTVNDVFQSLFKNPGKFMGLIKNVGDKLDRKIKSGDIKESELIAEAGEIVKKMKDMPGMGNIQSMLGKMGIPNMDLGGLGGLGGRNAKVDFAAMQNHLNKNMKLAQTKEKMRQKMQEKQNGSINQVQITEEQIEKEATLLRMLNSGDDGEIENLIFSTGEKMEKSMKPQKETTTHGKKKKHKKN